MDVSHIDVSLPLSLSPTFTLFKNQWKIYLRVRINKTTTVKQTVPGVCSGAKRRDFREFSSTAAPDVVGTQGVAEEAHFQTAAPWSTLLFVPVS